MVSRLGILRVRWLWNILELRETQGWVVCLCRMAFYNGRQVGVLEELAHNVEILNTHLEKQAGRQAAMIEILRSICEELKGLRNDIQEINKQQKKKDKPL